MSATVVGQVDRDHEDLDRSTFVALDHVDVRRGVMCDRTFTTFFGAATVTVATESEELEPRRGDASRCRLPPVVFELHIIGAISDEEGDRAGPFDVEILTTVVGEAETPPHEASGTDVAPTAPVAGAASSPRATSADNPQGDGAPILLVLLGGLVGMGLGIAAGRARP